MATPSYVTHRIVRGLPRDTAEALAAIPYGPFVCGAFLTEEAGPMPWDHIYAVAVVDKSFNMLFNHANPLRTPAKREPGGSLMVYAGGRPGPAPPGRCRTTRSARSSCGTSTTSCRPRAASSGRC